MKRIFSFRKRSCPLFVWGLLVGFWLAPSAASEEARPAADLSFFESRIRPVLVEHCYECHAAEASQIQGGLRVDTRAGLEVGGDSGAAVVPHKPAESLLLDALRYEGFEMPPRGKLPEAVIADFETWIAQGAVDPREGEAVAAAPGIDLDAGREHWAFQPLKTPPSPSVMSPSVIAPWAEGQVDQFIWDRLHEKSLSPVSDADRAVLLRRVYFDLTGLPPTRLQLESFLSDPSPEAYARVVDRLLQSPQFGERWAQHWLDLARFSESTGGGRSLLYGTAWKYRDFVIQAFNEDKPYDRFVIEQLAGDLLPYDDPQTGAEQLTATAFLMLGPHNYEDQDKEKLRMDVVDEQIDVMGRVFLGMTIGCARCHDHKFDPIPTADYYALAGVFRSTEMLVDGNVSGWTTREIPLPAEEREVLERHRAAVAALEQRIKDKPPEVEQLEAELKRLQESAPADPPRVTAVRDAKACGDAQISIRGDAHHLGEPVPRGVLSVVEEEPRLDIGEDSSGRLELARWIASDENPLTARVMANRVWHHLFGAGIVRTVDNFGTPGEPPSHPELLDYLAGRLIQQGWSIKSLIREIVLSRTYRLSSHDASADPAVDPANRWLRHQNRRRRDAEALRDAILVLSGQLDARLAGNTIREDTTSEYGYEFDGQRRSIYLPVFRNCLPDVFAVFDYADPNRSTGRRNVSTLSTQALFLLNSPWVLQHAEATATRILEIPHLEPEQRVERLYREALGREPNEQERKLALEYVGRGEDSEAWAQLCQAVMASIDFLDVR